MATKKKLNILPPPGAGNPDKKLYGNQTPGLKVQYTKNSVFDTGQMQRDELNAYNAQQTGNQMNQYIEDARKKGYKINEATGEIINPDSSIINDFNSKFTTTKPGTGGNSYGGLSEGFIKSNPNQAIADLMDNGYSSDQARSIVNNVRGGKNITLNSNEFMNRPLVPQVQSLQDTLSSVQNFFDEGMSQVEKRRNQIRKDVEAQFASQFQDQERINNVRNQLFSAGRAQAGDLGFGASNLAREGIVATDQYGSDQMGRLQALKEAEINARIAAEEDKNFKRKQDFLGMANQLRSQQLQEFQNFFQNQLALRGQERADTAMRVQNAQSALNNISNLSADQIAELGDLSGIESQLGLPSGYIDALRQTKLAASQAQSQEQFAEFFNGATKLALSTPAGQNFSLVNPFDGKEYTFEGGEKDIQIVTNDGGIWSVDKNTNQVTQLKAPTPKSSGGSGGRYSGGSGNGLRGTITRTPMYNQDTGAYLGDRLTDKYGGVKFEAYTPPGANMSRPIDFSRSKLSSPFNNDSFSLGLNDVINQVIQEELGQ